MGDSDKSRDCPFADTIRETKLKVDRPFWYLNVGHVLAILSPIAVFLIAWGTMGQKQKDLDSRVTTLEQAEKVNRTDAVKAVEKVGDKVNALEIQVARLATAMELRGLAPRPKSAVPNVADQRASHTTEGL